MTASRKILIVEDEKDIANVSFRLIESLNLGLEVVVAEDSERALNILNEGGIGLALIDGNLTDGKTGPSVARAARGFEVPFISTSSDGELAAEIGKYGPRYTLAKPYTLDELETAIRKFYSTAPVKSDNQ